TANEQSPKVDTSGCYGAICPGDTAFIDKSSWDPRKVSIDAFTADGKVVVTQENGNRYTLGRDDVAIGWPNRQGVNCKSGACVGQLAWVSRHNWDPREVVIVGIRQIGTSFVVYMKENLIYYRDFDLNTLAVSERDGRTACDGNRCAGDTVTFHRHNWTPFDGTLLGLTNDGHGVILREKDQKLIRAELSDFTLKKKRTPSLEEQERMEADQAAQSEGFSREAYDQARRQGSDHHAAMELARGPVFTGFTSISGFLQKLSQHVYAFDRAYLEELASAVGDAEKSRSPIDLRTYSGAMILPYIRHVNYPGLRERFLNPSVKAMEQHLAAQGVRSLLDMEAVRGARLLALRFMAASFRTSMSVANDAQKQESGRLLAVLGRALATRASLDDLREMHSEAARLEAHILDLAQNPYLTARSAADGALLQFLRQL
ncbi:MAG: hypothetical protein HUU37_11045, partial [Bdellovibrionales bacterium]|nr:hypothetical protein [Bdellovibrionales bacterium]